MDKISAPSLPGPSDLLTEAWKIYQLKWKYLAKLILVSILINLIPLSIIGLTVLLFFGWLLGVADAGLPAMTHDLVGNPILGIVLVGTVFSFLVLILLQSWSQLALLIGVVSDEVLSVKETYSQAWKKFNSYFWTTLLMGLVIMGGCLLFFVPGLILAVFLFATGFVVLTENVSGFKALAKSRAYLVGYEWPVFTRIAMIILIGIVYELFASQLIKSFPSFSFLTGLISIFVVGPIFMIYSFLVFKHLKKVHGEVKGGSTTLFKIFSVLPFIFILLAAYLGWNIISSEEFANLVQKEIQKSEYGQKNNYLDSTTQIN